MSGAHFMFHCPVDARSGTGERDNRQKPVDNPTAATYNPIWDLNGRQAVPYSGRGEGEVSVDRESLNLLADINCAIIQFRGLYAAWAKAHGISYNEMLVLYTIRDQGFCTQQQICDSYLLPRQTMNHVILDMKRRGLLAVSPGDCVGREKAFVLTGAGERYAAPLLKSLNEIEMRAVQACGLGSIRAMVADLLSYDGALRRAMEEEA